MKSHKIRRKIATLQFVENTTETVDIPLGYDLNNISLHLSGSYIIGTAVVTSVKTLAPSQLIKRISLYADGNQKFESTTGRLAAFAAFERGLARKITAMGVTVATHPIECTFFLDRENADGPRPKDSSLHTQRPYMSLLQLDIEFGALADCVVIGSAVLTGAITVDVILNETVELDKADAFEGRWVRRGTLQEVDVTATNSEQSITLPVGGFLRGCKIISLDENNDGVDTVINNVTIRSGVDTRVNLPWNSLQNENLNDFNLQAGDLPDGVAYADCTDKGKLTTLFDLQNKSQAELVLDVTKPAGGNAKLYVQTINYYWQPAIEA